MPRWGAFCTRALLHRDTKANAPHRFTPALGMIGTQMIRVIDSIACSGVNLEHDPWIPMKVTWEPRPAEKPLYLIISGSNGGEVEMKVDPTTGMLVQVVVIEEPRQVEGTGPLPPDPRTQGHSPVIERTPWGVTHGSDDVDRCGPQRLRGFVRRGHGVRSGR
jgi:hypothetical protein